MALLPDAAFPGDAVPGVPSGSSGDWSTASLCFLQKRSCNGAVGSSFYTV